MIGSRHTASHTAHWHTCRRLIIVTALLLLSKGNASALSVAHRGPRSAAAASTLKRALMRAGLGQVSLDVYLKRGPGQWTMIVTVTDRRTDKRLVRRMSVPRGLLSTHRAEALASELQRTLRRQAIVRPRRQAIVATSAPTRRRSADVATKATPQTDPLGFTVAKPVNRPSVARTDDRDDRGRDLDNDRDGDEADRDADEADRDARKDDRDDRHDEDIEKDRQQDDRPTLRRRARRNPPRVFFAHVGLELAMRRFLLEDGRNLAIDFDTGSYSQIGALFQFYPLQLFRASPYIQSLGIQISYAHSAGLHTNLGDTEELRELTTDLWQLGVGLNYRVPRFRHPNAPRFDLNFGVDYLSFTIADNPQINDLSLITLVAGARIEIPVTWYLNLFATGEYRVALAAKSAMLEPFAAKVGALSGFAVKGGLCGKIAGGLGYTTAVSFRRIGGEIPALADPLGSARVIDRTIALGVALSYEI